MDELLTKATQTADLLRSDLGEIIMYANSPKPQGLSVGDKAIIQLVARLRGELASIQNTLAELT